MGEFARIARNLLRPLRVKWAMGIALLVSCTMLLLDRSLPSGVFASLAGFSAYWAGLSLVIASRFHVFRPGSALVPGYRREVLLAALGLTLGSAMLPVVAAATRGLPIATMLTSSMVGMAVAWIIGPVFPETRRVGLSILSLALAIDTALFLRFSQGQREFWIRGVDPSWQMMALIALSIAGVAWSLTRTSRMRDDSWAMRHWATRGSADCSQCGGQAGLPLWLVGILPPFARRRLPQRDNGRTVESRLRESLFRYSLHPLSPMGMALFYLPFLMITTWMASRQTDATDLMWNPNLLLLNALIVWFGGLTRDRLRRESLRPSNRHQLVQGLLSGLRHDVMAFTVYFLTLSLLIHLVAIPEAMRTRVYWLGYLMAPFLMTLGYGLSLWASQWTKWSGMVGFLPTWILASVAFAMNENDPRPVVLLICMGACVLLAGLGILLAREGARSWESMEVG
jgi:hypothetical protein